MFGDGLKNEDIVIDFVNTLDVDAGTDRLADVESWQQWCGCDQEPGDVERARSLRAQLRSLAGGGGDVPTVDLPVCVRFDSSGVRLSGDSPLTVIAAAAATLTIEGCIQRIKLCAASDCRVAFYDTSKNKSRQWCDMKVCGNRAKARTHRARSAAASS